MSRSEHNCADIKASVLIEHIVASIRAEGEVVSYIDCFLFMRKRKDLLKASDKQSLYSHKEAAHLLEKQTHHVHGVM